MGALFDENGNEIGYIYEDENDPLINTILVLGITVVLPVFHWISAIKLIISDGTPIAQRLAFFSALVSIIATMLIRGKKISERPKLEFPRCLIQTAIELTAFGAITSGIFLCLGAIIDQRLTLFAAIRFAFTLSVLPALLTTWRINREEVKAKFHRGVDGLKYIIKNIISVWKK